MDTNIIKEVLKRCQGMSSSIEKTLKDINILFFTGDKGMVGKCQGSMVALGLAIRFNLNLIIMFSHYI